ncbi:methyltransferase [Trypanosoma rangeli]|uniref:Methyltransferase n=1 Tax=Trypanosoma rangeli TaxID=5698 RepID=A0A3R7KYY8_TRYRA|nr:methyltransferase [Trypanosoma rangeli]RNF12435.1 methyltransferase [Trypanosoma rangeli]|eukprot:RNF12435.1 methyltransferase [Trypanosoma rangeli]
MEGICCACSQNPTMRRRRRCRLHTWRRCGLPFCRRCTCGSWLRVPTAETNQSFPLRFKSGMTVYHMFGGTTKGTCAAGPDRPISSEAKEVEQARRGGDVNSLAPTRLMFLGRSSLYALKSLDARNWCL